MIKNLFSIGLVFFFAMSYSQKSINNYKYVVVPIQFDFVKDQDQYRTSSLTKYLFNQLGIKAYFDVQEQPEDLIANRCKALYANVHKVKGGFLKTNIQIKIKDCRGNTVFMSETGSTREKMFKEAYDIAIRKAFESFKFMEYSYMPLEQKVSKVYENQIIKPIQNDSLTKDEIESLKQEIKELKEEKAFEEKTVDEGLVMKEQSEIENLNINDDLLYAQKIEGGFQLVNSIPEKIMVLFITAAENVFMVKGKEAIVFKKDGEWIYSENTGVFKTQRVLKIKF